MPGFNDNLRRAREAAGLSPEDLANRVGAAPLWLIHLEAIGAALPELSQLVRLADALGCSVDELLAGRDEEFDHPRRRHAALIAARLGSVSLLLGTLNRARARHALTEADDKEANEPGLLVTVHRCRAWVTSPDAEIALAAGLERELDAHIARIAAVCERVNVAGSSSSHSPSAATARSTPPSASRVPAESAVTLREALSSTDGPAGASDPRAPAAQPAPPPASPPRRACPPGHRTPLWARPSVEGVDYVCEMFTAADGITLRVVCGDRILATRACRNLDEAFGQSSAWRRVPDPETLASEPLPDTRSGAA